MANYLILSCDGGGIRGYLSSLLLKRLNDDLGIFEPNNQNINLYAGTSTGGLIALALAFGKSIDSVVELYATAGKDIFNPLGIQPGCLLKEAPTAGLTEVKGLWQVLYDDIGDPSVRTVIEKFVPGNPKLSSLPSNVMVTTFQLNDGNNPPSWNPLVIDNFAGSPGSNTDLYHAALSTSVAPVYFPPYYHPQFGWCSDGGLFANNPAAVAVGRAIEAGHQLPDIVLLSIGTGITVASIEVSKPARLCYGLKYWAWFEAYGSTPPFAILNALMDGASISNDKLTSSLLGDRYMRVNPTLPESVALDDYSPEALKMFRKVADDYSKSSEWSTIENWVKNTFQK